MAECGEYKSILAGISSEWDQAEKDIKIAEQVCGEVVTPSIKELRYAGRRIVDALNEMAADGDKQEISNYLQDAKFNCHKARHDAIDAAISKISITLELMSQKLGYKNIITVYSGFSDFWAQLSATKEKIVASRGDRENRENLYAAIENSEIQKLVVEFGKIQRAEPIIMSIAKKEKMAMWGSYAIGLIGIIIAIVAIFVPLID